MPAVKLNTVIEAICKKAKVDPATIKEVLDKTADIDFPSEVQTTLDSALMTEEIAKIKLDGKLKRDALDPIDQDIAADLETAGLDEAAKADILGTKSTYEKLKKSRAYIREAAKKADKAGDNNDELVKLKDKYNKLVASNTDTAAKHAQQLKEVEDKYSKKFASSALKAKLATLTYSLPDTLTQEEKVNIIKTLVEAEATAQGFQIVLNADDTIRLAASDGTDPIDSKTNTKVELDPFMQGFFAKKGLLANSDPSSTKKDSNGFTIISGGQDKKVDPYAAKVAAETQAAAARM